MQVRVLYFAWLRERIGFGEEGMDLPAGVDHVDQLIDFLAARSPGHAAAFARLDAIRCAVNQDFAQTGALLHYGDEIAFFPPVTGG